MTFLNLLFISLTLLPVNITIVALLTTLFTILIHFVLHIQVLLLIHYVQLRSVAAAVGHHDSY